jgi:hypothetical protein
MDRIIDRLKPLTDEQLHLQWIYNRLIMQYGERPQYDYMVKLKKIIDTWTEKPSSRD